MKNNRSDVEYEKVIKNYEELMKYQEGDIETRSILSSRIDREICPPNIMSMTAKQLFCHVTSVREEGANTPWETAVRNLLGTKLTSTVDLYCNEFLQHYLDTNRAAEVMPTQNSEGPSGVLELGDLGSSG